MDKKFTKSRARGAAQRRMSIYGVCVYVCVSARARARRGETGDTSGFVGTGTTLDRCSTPSPGPVLHNGAT